MKGERFRVKLVWRAVSDTVLNLEVSATVNVILGNGSNETSEHMYDRVGRVGRR